jgi:hypothetical protein
VRAPRNNVLGIGTSHTLHAPAKRKLRLASHSAIVLRTLSLPRILEETRLLGGIWAGLTQVGRVTTVVSVGVQTYRGGRDRLDSLVG